MEDRADGRGPAKARSRRVHDWDASRGRGRRDEDLGDAQPALLADGTAFDVDPGQPEHERGHGFGRGSERCWGLGEEVPAPRELGTTGAVGEEAEVANADKAVRDDVKEKATDEFLGRERHDLHAVAVGVVSPAEAHDALGVADEPLVGDRDAVGVPTEVLEELRRPGERPFGVHDPVMLPKFPEPGREGLWLSQRGERAGEAELAAGEGAVKRLQVLAAEDPGEGADGEKKAGRGGDPARAVLGERAAGHDTV